MPELNDPLAASQQCRGQSGTKPAGAFDGPQRRAVAPPEGDQLAVASRIGRNRQVLITDAMGSTPRRPTRAFRTCTVSSQTPDSRRTYRSGWKIATRSSTSTDNLSRCIGSTLFFTVITRTPTDVLAADVCSSIGNVRIFHSRGDWSAWYAGCGPESRREVLGDLVHVVIKRQSQ